MAPTLNEITQLHRPDPFSPEITGATRETGENYNTAADHAALLATPANELPPAFARLKVELDQSNAAAAKKEQKLAEATLIYSAWLELLREIAERQQRLAGQESRLANAKFEIANAPTNVRYALANERNAGFQPVVQLLHSLTIAREMANLFPELIEQERKAIEEMQARAGGMAKDFN